MHEQEDGSAEYGHFCIFIPIKGKRIKWVKRLDHLLQNADSDPAKIGVSYL